MTLISLFTFTVRTIEKNEIKNKYRNVENGHWIIGSKYQNVGGFKSHKKNLEAVPRTGWLYNDGSKWNYDDMSIKVHGKIGKEK